MSIAAMTRAFELDLPGLIKWVLVALSDNANQSHEAWPSIPSLMAKTGLGESTVRRTLRDLQAREFILDAGVAPNGQTRWQLNIGIIEDAPNAPRPHVKGCPPSVRRELIESSGRTCSYCGYVGDDKTGSDGRPWSVDRVVPGAKGGAYTPENIALACWICNVRKRDRDVRLVALPGGSSQTPPGVPGRPRGGVRQAPEPSVEPSVIRLADLPKTAWWRSLAQQYPHIDLAAELAKAQDWHRADKVKSPKLYFRNWVEKAAARQPERSYAPSGDIEQQLRELEERAAVPA